VTKAAARLILSATWPVYLLAYWNNG
jgi:hypothetical protein